MFQTVEKIPVICIHCKYCRSIDMDGRVDCELGIPGKAKLYCRKFLPRKEPEEADK